MSSRIVGEAPVCSSGQFDAVEVFEGVAEVDEHEVAFVADQGEERGLVRVAFFVSRFHGTQDFDGLLEDPVTVEAFLRVPGTAMEAEHLVKAEGAFESQGNGVGVGHIRLVPILSWEYGHLVWIASGEDFLEEIQSFLMDGSVGCQHILTFDIIRLALHTRNLPTRFFHQ